MVFVLFFKLIIMLNISVFYDFCGISSYNGIFGYILGYNGTSGKYGTFSDSYIANDNYSVSKPNVVFYCNGFSNICRVVWDCCPHIIVVVIC